jgi:hypothetical protein
MKSFSSFGGPSLQKRGLHVGPLHSVACPPGEKFQNRKQRTKSLISGAKLKTFEKHISNSILNIVIFENCF